MKRTEQGQGQEAVRDGRPEGRLAGGAVDVRVDPLVIASDVREGVDLLLRDRVPVADRDLLAHEPAERLDALEDSRRHDDDSWPTCAARAYRPRPGTECSSCRRLLTYTGVGRKRSDRRRCLR